jgi:hypothetical protein
MTTITAVRVEDIRFPPSAIARWLGRDEPGP